VNAQLLLRKYACALICVTALAGQAVGAETNFPTKTVRIIVAFAPGQATDIIARLLANELTQMWKQQVVVENISGGNSIPGTFAGRNAAADGYTITFGTSSSFAVNPSILPNLPYDPVRDFTMVNGVFISPWVIVASPKAPYKTLKEMVAAAKEKPNSLLWSVSATSLQLGAALFKSRAGVQIVDVPYKGSGQAITDLLGGQIPMMIDTVAATLPNIKAGKMKVLASMSAKRLPWLPDVPTVVELGYPGVEAAGWGGLAVPKGTPSEIVDKISADVRVALKDSNLNQRINDIGAIVDARGPKEWSNFVEAEVIKWADIARSANVKAH